MARRWVVSNGTHALEVHTGKVAIGGVVKNITKACVAENGIVRQFFPFAPSAQDTRIAWTNDAIVVTDSVIDPTDCVTSIIFNRDLGTFTYENYPSADTSGIYLNPPVSVPSQYLIRVDQVSGTGLTGTLATWIDINSAAAHEWSLDHAAIGTATAVANITIAPDDGLGSPVTSKQVVKAVTFNAEVTAGASIAWSDIARALVEETESVDADCDLIFNPDGSCVGSADTSGSFNENWHSDAPSPAAPGNFTVNATLVSGTAPTGSALASDLTLDMVRQWTLLATTGEDLSCALDITVSDGVDPITKRVTMDSERNETISYNIWSATPSWIQVDDNPLGGQVTLTLSNDGTTTYTNGTPAEDLTQDWHSQAPAPTEPQNYEVMLELISGDSSLMSGSAINTWLPLSTNKAWNATGIAGLLRMFTWDVHVRRIGAIATTKRVTAAVGTEGTL